MSDYDEKREVIVIGGGPAGSTAAALLARSGHDVLLLEKAKFPREHVGESLLPFCYWLFEDLGVVDEMARRFVRKPGVRFLNKDGSVSTTWCFNHVINDRSYRSFQVARGEFDQILLKNAVRLGAEVREQVRVKDVDLTTTPDEVTVRAVNEEGEEKVYRARFLIDASGRDAIVGAKYGWRKVREELDRTAVWSHWGGVKLSGGVEEGLSMILYMGEEQKGWIWVFPLDVDRVTAGFVAQNSYIRDQRKKFLAEGSTNWEYDLCMQELTRSPVVTKILEGGELKMPMMVNGNYSYEVKNHFGRNYAMIGDARGFIDPIFSSGVFLSMKTAYLVADALHRELAGEIEGENHLMSKAYELVTGAYNFVHRMIRLFYNPHALTWAEVGADGQSHKRHETAMAAGHYMLAGDFFENHEKYNKMFDVLENPAYFRSYNKVVIGRRDFQSDCNTKWEDVFGDLEQLARTDPAKAL
jgi:flavin-dependent dehydrogenase